jgi:hypothetical protein
LHAKTHQRNESSVLLPQNPCEFWVSIEFPGAIGGRWEWADSSVDVSKMLHVVAFALDGRDSEIGEYQAKLLSD